MIERWTLTLARALNIVAAVWLFMLAIVILIDVVGRGTFNQPFAGTFEIVKNSVVAILFLQIPFAVLSGGMLRTTLTYDLLGQTGRRVIDAMSYFLGACLFLAVGIGGWPDMITAWQILEFEGAGAFEFPTYPIRTIIVFLAFLASLTCLLHIVSVFRSEYRDDHLVDDDIPRW